MSNRKSIFWLLLGVITLAAAHFMLSYCGGVETRIVRRTTLASPNRHFTSVTLERPGEPVTRLSKTLSWRLEEPFVGSVDAPVVLRLLDALSFTPVDDTISDADLLKRGGMREDFALNEPRLKLTLEGDGARECISFGAYTPSSNGVYAAVAGVDAVFVATTGVLAAVDVPTDRLRSRTLFPVGAESVVAFDVKRGTGSLLAFSREGGRWKVGDSPAAASKVKPLLSGVLAAEAKSFVWPVGATNEARSATASLLAVYELDPESAVTVTMKCVDGVDRQLTLGGEADEGLVYALVQNGTAVVTVDARLRDLARQDPVMFTDARLFPYDAAAVTSFTISDGDAGYVVARDAAGVWRLDSPVAAAADAVTAAALLDKVLALSAVDVRSSGLKVAVSTNSEPVTVSRASLLGARRLEDLRSKEILRIDPVVVKRIVQTLPGADVKPVAVVYGRERRTWSVEGASRASAVNERSVMAVLSAVNPLQALRIARLKVSAEDLQRFGLETPHMTVAIDQDRENAVRRNIIIGAKTAGGRFATVGSADAVFVLSDETVARLASDIVGE